MSFQRFKNQGRNGIEMPALVNGLFAAPAAFV
jgi:hypothetical protein